MPTSTQRNTLMAYIGGFTTGGGKLKETGINILGYPNMATNQYNLNGARWLALETQYMGKNAETTLMCSDDAGKICWGLEMINILAYATSPTAPKYYGWSIRLMRTATAEEQLLADGTACEHYVGNDGKIYRTVKIGTQVWLADNLAEKLNSDGKVTIPFAGSYGSTSPMGRVGCPTGALCAYDNDWSNV